MKLSRVSLTNGKVFSSAAMVKDEDYQGKDGSIIALVVFSNGGNLIYLHKHEYANEKNLTQIQVAAEETLGETLAAKRFKVFLVETMSWKKDGQKHFDEKPCPAPGCERVLCHRGLKLHYKTKHPELYADMAKKMEWGS